MTDSLANADPGAQDAAIAQWVRRLADMLVADGRMVATAESCTGGMIAARLTSLPGSSQWFERGFVTYSNEAKMEMLGVSAATLAREGAVSEPTAAEMAAGAIAHSRADIAVAVTGIAGPGGGSDQKPVGTVCVAWCRRSEEPRTHTFHFTGHRDAVRRATVLVAVEGLVAGTKERSA